MTQQGTGLYVDVADAFLMVGERNGASWSLGTLYLESSDSGEIIFRCARDNRGALAGFNVVRLVPTSDREQILFSVDRGGSNR